MITVKRPSGLAVPFEPPEISSEAAIERSWEIPPYGLLLEPKRPEYLPTYPDLGYQRYMWPWYESPGLISAMIQGLGAV